MTRTIILTLILSTQLFITTVCLAAPPLPRTTPKRVGGPSVQFGATSITASGMAPEGRTAFAAVSIGTEQMMRSIGGSAAVIDADANGDATLSVPEGVSTRSIWIVVDTAGGYTVASPVGMLLREMDVPGRGVAANGNGVLRRLLFDRYSLDVFLIRPGKAVWRAHLQDGRATDGDGVRDGRIDADLSAFEAAVETTETLERIQRGDLLFVVDPQSLEFVVLKQAE